MDGLERLRKAHRDYITKLFGSKSDSPLYAQSQRKAYGHTTEFMSYPEIILPPIQITDPNSQQYMQWIYMVDAVGLDEGVLDG